MTYVVWTIPDGSVELTLKYFQIYDNFKGMYINKNF